MSQEQQEVVVYDRMASTEPLSYADIRRNTQLVKKAVKEVMLKDADYGTIPGCGDKPALLKPGAEKLMLLFKLGCFLDVVNQSEHDLVKYVIKTRIVHIPTGRELGIGVGSCSSDEEKYKWKKAICDEEFDATPEERRRIKFYAGKFDYKTRKRGPATQVKQIRTNPSDLDNTILKMAAKRSKVDGVITVTGASDILLQGEDDILVEQERPVDTFQQPQAKQAQEPTKSAAGEDFPASEGNGSPPPIPSGYKGMTARKDGLCKGCGRQITAGDYIAFSSQKGAFHPDCCT